MEKNWFPILQNYNEVKILKLHLEITLSQQSKNYLCIQM